MGKPIQDSYPDSFSHCYGCGRLNEAGLQIKTVLEGTETVSRYCPQSYHMAIPGYVYGGLMASVIDCHGTGSAALFMYHNQNRDPATEPTLRFVTASLHVDYLKPTPLGPELIVRGIATEIGRRKVVVACQLETDGQLCARGEVVAVLLPDNWTP
jgi:acyl-coenzyme A thioesterase PaaI-like protein